MTRKALNRKNKRVRKLRFLTVKNKSFRKLIYYEEEKEARKIRKTMKGIDDFKTIKKDKQIKKRDNII